jgi:putative peptidoglycan lipid II flippase
MAAGMTLDASTSRRPGLFRTALLLFPLQALFRGGEAVMPLLLAAWFGRSAATDLYYVLAAYFVFAGALVTGAFQDSSVVPVLVEVEEKDPGQLPTIAGALLGHTLAVAAVLAVAFGALAASAVLVASEARMLALELVVVMSFGVVATAVRSFYVGLLNARGRFSLHPVASGLGVGLTLGLIAFGRGAFGVLIVPVALVLGELFAIALLARFTERVVGLRVRPHLGRPEPVRRILRLVRLEVTGSLITRVNPVIDQLMSRMAGVLGGGTLLLYATNVAALPTSVLQATLFPVFLTRLSQEAARPQEFLRVTRRTLIATTLLLLLSAAILAALRAPVCRLLFLHGVMDEGGARSIAEILPWALLGAAPFGALLLLARAHVALQNSRIMPSMGVLNATCNAVFNLVFVGRMGLSGIALSTSVTYAIVAGVFWVRLRPQRRT